MPRMARKTSGTKVYHVILGGNSKQDIFLDEQDYKKLIKEIIHTKEKYKYELYAYCLMSNHVHLVIYDKNDKLSKSIQSLAISYSEYFSRKYDKVGHLFQNRFLSKEVETSRYLMQLCRYIHQNPVKAKISKIDTYKWSSFQEYVRDAKIINTKMLLSLFGNNLQEAIKNFKNFHKVFDEDVNADYEYELKVKLTDEELIEKIKKILNIYNLKEICEYSTKIRNEKISKLSIVKGVSNIQIARVIGVSRGIVDRAMKDNRKEEGDVSPIAQKCAKRKRPQ